MDSDAQFLLGSASGAMEERERLRAKHERLKHEAATWRAMQLKEAAALVEQLEELLGRDRHEVDQKAQCHGLLSTTTPKGALALLSGFTWMVSGQTKHRITTIDVQAWL